MWQKIKQNYCSCICKYLSFAVVVFICAFMIENVVGGTLPLPAVRLPQIPAIAPTVITAGGQRLLLDYTDIKVSYNFNTDRLEVNRPNWWVINYPLKQIVGLENLTNDEIARFIFNTAYSEVKNWYIMTPSSANSTEPAPPTDPAPITISDNPSLYVDNQNPATSDVNPGTSQAQPLRTIQAAVDKAVPGTIIRVNPGVYRETVLVTTSGTESEPIIIEGVRSAAGKLPVITANEPFPANAWEAVAGLPGVYRAPIFTDVMGRVSDNGKSLIERSVPNELQANEYCFNRASVEFLNFRLDGSVNPHDGQVQEGKIWKYIASDSAGHLDFEANYGPNAADRVFWASTWVWVPPADINSWDPNNPAEIISTVTCDGPFRAARMAGSNILGQVNKYRVWVNNKLYDSVVYSTAADNKVYTPHPHLKWGHTDIWQYFVMQEGWNQLVFQFDTSLPVDKSLKFSLSFSSTFGNCITQAAKPVDLSQPPTSGTASSLIKEYLVLGPFDAATADKSIYVRLGNDANPQSTVMDLVARKGAIVDIKADFIQFRGFEVRDGSSYQQTGQLNIDGQGVLIEGNIIRNGEFSGIRFLADGTQVDAPIVIRNNWIFDAGNTGIGGSGSSSQLTADNQDNLTPGRSPLIIENNYIANCNWAAYKVGWESGGIKLIRMTGALIRYNTIRDISGGGLWFDWENFNNIVDGNLFEKCFAYGVAIEASPGPNLLANNIVVNTKPDVVWFRWGLLSWDSTRSWAVNNIVDGKWDTTPVWYNQTGTDGIMLGMNKYEDRPTLYGRYDNPVESYANNVVVGCNRALEYYDDDSVTANYTDSGDLAQPLANLGFMEQSINDFRLNLTSPLNDLGMATAESSYVNHDFYGLLRNVAAQKRSIGAHRQAAQYQQTTIEVETISGDIKVIDSWSSMRAYWKFDEGDGNSVQDEGNNYGAGVLVGDYMWVLGRYGNAINFTGNGSVTIPNDYNFGTHLTIAAWVKVDDGTSADRAIVTIYGSGSSKAILRINSNGSLHAMTNITGNWTSYDAWGGSVVKNEWVHVTLVIDNLTLRLYQDGLLTGTGQIPDISDIAGGTIYIGQSGMGWSPQYFLGTIDDVRIFDRALTDSEIANLVNGEFRWNLDERAGNKVDEANYKMAPGTLSGDSAWTEGKSEGAINFTGNGSVTIPNDYNFGTHLSISAWVKVDAGTSADRAIVTIYGSGSSKAILRINSNGSLQAMTNITGNWTSYDAWGGAVMQNEWIHVTLVIDDLTLRLYQNGLLTGTGQIPDISDIVGGPIYIGQSGMSWSPQYFLGTIDDVRIFDRALTDAEVFAIWSE